DLVRPDAERADDAELRRVLEHARRHRGLRADAEDVDAVEGCDEVVLVEGAGAVDDLDAMGREDLGRERMEVLEEKSGRHGASIDPSAGRTKRSPHDGPVGPSGRGDGL